MYQFTLRSHDKVPLYQQLANNIKRDIEGGLLVGNTQLPSINTFSDQLSIARDTIERAYNHLKKEGYIVSTPGRGYFVSTAEDKKMRVLLIFNKLSAYKKIIYTSFLETLGASARVDFHLHDYNVDLCKAILEEGLGRYHYYVVMPHFSPGADKVSFLDILKKIPPRQLVLLDRNIRELGEEHTAIFQDYEQDIYKTLRGASDLLAKYQRLVVIFPDRSNHPVEVIAGARSFCKENRLSFSVLAEVEKTTLIPGTVYLVTAESELAKLIKKSRAAGLVPGQGIGIISLNETALKEILDITVITTDFEAMGRSAAELLLANECRQLKNEFAMIRRGSL